MKARTWQVARASDGHYAPSCFRIAEHDVAAPGEGQILVETLYLSLDPTHLNWVKLIPELQFLPIGLGDPMLGTNLGIVRASGDPRFTPGQVVMGTWAWSTLAIADTRYVGPALPPEEMSFEQQLTVLSHVGRAAAAGLIAIGGIKPADAVLVSGAAGATGSIAAQIAKAEGCRVVGIAGGPQKVRYLLDELGLDGAIDYRAGNLVAQIAQQFPNGVDLYFDNVGGETLDAVLANMAVGCRIAICGAIAQYDAGAQSRFDGIRNLPMLIFRQARMEGYVASQFGPETDAKLADRLVTLYKSGQIKPRTHVIAFDEMPDKLGMLLTGENQGKLIARV